MRKRCARVARPTRISRRPVANGSSVPACPTFVRLGSERRTSATTSCDVTPAGFARSSTPSTEKLRSRELLAHVPAQLVDQLRVGHGGREAGRLGVPATAEGACYARHV